MVSGPTEQFDYQTIVHGILRRFPGIPYYVRRPFNRFRRDVMRSSVRERIQCLESSNTPGFYKRKYQVYKYTLNFKRQSYDGEKDVRDHCTGISFSNFYRGIKDTCTFQMSQSQTFWELFWHDCHSQFLFKINLWFPIFLQCRSCEKWFQPTILSKS